jgi:hypothetical protein
MAARAIIVKPSRSCNSAYRMRRTYKSRPYTIGILPGAIIHHLVPNGAHPRSTTTGLLIKEVWSLDTIFIGNMENGSR